MSEGLPVSQEQVDAANLSALNMRAEFYARNGKHEAAWRENEETGTKYVDLSNNGRAVLRASGVRVGILEQPADVLARSVSTTDRALGEELREAQDAHLGTFQKIEDAKVLVGTNMAGARREVMGPRQDAYTEAAKQMAEAQGVKINLQR